MGITSTNTNRYNKAFNIVSKQISNEPINEVYNNDKLIESFTPFIAKIKCDNKIIAMGLLIDKNQVILPKKYSSHSSIEIKKVSCNIKSTIEFDNFILAKIDIDFNTTFSRICSLDDLSLDMSLLHDENGLVLSNCNLQANGIYINSANKIVAIYHNQSIILVKDILNSVNDYRKEIDNGI